MESCNILNNYEEELFKKGDCYLSTIDKLKENNLLDGIIESLNIINPLKKDLTNYLNFLFDEKTYNYYNKKILLESQFKNDLGYISQYILCLYCDCKDAYRNLPLLLKKLIDKLDLVEFKGFSLEDITKFIYKYYDIIDDYNEKLEKNICEFKNKICQLYTKYDKYQEKYNPAYVNVFDQTEFFVWSEHKVYDDEIQRLRNTNYKEYPKWVSKDYGDGYGFDILSYDILSNTEILIEVKSGSSESIDLTENEYLCMKNCHMHGAIYYVCKYIYDKNNNSVYTKILRYDPYFDMLCDENNNFYDYYEYTEYNQDGYKVKKYKFNQVMDKNKVKKLNYN